MRPREPGAPPRWWHEARLWRRRRGTPDDDPFGLRTTGLWARGFTLVEVLIVVLLVGTLAAIGVPIYFDALDRARVARAIGDIAAVEEEIRLFWFDNARFPSSLAEVNRSQMLDPYGNPYEYLNIANAGQGGGGGSGRGGAQGGGGAPGAARKDRFLVPLNSDFDLYSMGKDGESVAPLTAPASQDDVVRANDGGYIGLASEY